jgi:glutamine synthetase
MAKIDTKTELPVWAEYGWIDGGDPLNPNEGHQIRSKSCFLYITESSILDVKSYPEWNYDGSSTNQADTKHSDVILKPVRVFRDPMKERRDPSSPVTVIVWCATYNSDGTPHSTNYRHKLEEFIKENETWDEEQDPVFGLEQEYQFVSRKDNNESIVSEGQEKEIQTQYYCGYGSCQRLGRKIAEEHARRCAAIGIILWGVNAEVAPGQWEYQTRPNLSLDAADELWVTRWILIRTAEDLEVNVRFHPKPLGDKFNGSGCHINFSFKKMREEEDYYKQVIENMKTYQEEKEKPWAYYGSGNELRLTGHHETSSMDEFRYGVGDRGASIRIPSNTDKKKKGHIEDRRPAANIDPYRAILWILKSIQ